MPTVGALVRLLSGCGMAGGPLGSACRRRPVHSGCDDSGPTRHDSELTAARWASQQPAETAWVGASNARRVTLDAPSPLPSGMPAVVSLGQTHRTPLGARPCSRGGLRIHGRPSPCHGASHVPGGACSSLRTPGWYQHLREEAASVFAACVSAH